MQSGPDDLLALIRRYYQAYENDDRPAIEQLLHPDFTFTSPDDDRIDRVTYFEQCWPPTSTSSPSHCWTSAPTSKVPWSDTGLPGSPGPVSPTSNISNLPAIAYRTSTFTSDENSGEQRQPAFKLAFASYSEGCSCWRSLAVDDLGHASAIQSSEGHWSDLPLFRPDITEVVTRYACVSCCRRSLPLAVGRCCCCHRCCQLSAGRPVAS